MNKRLLIMVFLCLSFVANAQYEKLVESTFPGVITKTIVRQYDKTNIVGYVETGSGNFFFFTDVNMQNIQEFQMLQDYYVTDFEIYNDKAVYMCGRRYNSASGYDEGFIGFFRISSILNNTDGIYFNNATLYTSRGGRIDRFDELEVYKINGPMGVDVSVVAIGKAYIPQPDISGFRSVVFEARGYDCAPIGWSYADGVSLEKTEEITQISVTNNYVVTGGTMYDKYSAIKIRAFNKYNATDIFDWPFGITPTIYDYVYFFPSSNITTAIDFPINDNWQMTSMGGNDVAVAAFWQPYGQHYNTTYDGVLLHVYDIASIMSTPGTLPVYAAIDYTQHNIGWPRIADLRYNKPKSVLHMLMTTDCQNLGNESVTAEIDYPPTSNIARYHYFPNDEFDHIDNFHSYDNGISIGHERWTNNLRLYTFPVNTPLACNTWQQLKYYEVDDFISKTLVEPLYIYRDILDQTVFWPGLYDRQNPIRCQR